MIYKIIFLRSDAVLFENKYEWLPVCANSENEAVKIFKKYLGNPYHYDIVDISLLSLEEL